MPQQETSTETRNPFDDDPNLVYALVSLIKKSGWNFRVEKYPPQSCFPGTVYIIQKRENKQFLFFFNKAVARNVGMVSFTPAFAQRSQDSQDKLPGFESKYLGLTVRYLGNDAVEQNDLNYRFADDLEEKLGMHSADGEHIWRVDAFGSI